MYTDPHICTFFSVRGSNSRALKVAGLTTLACLLLGSQVFTAYMVFGQRQQIQELQGNNERLSKQMTRSNQGKRWAVLIQHGDGSQKESSA